MCINKKVVVGLGVAALAVVAFAPNLIGSVLPLLVIAACPLSMLAMLWAMSNGRSDGSGCQTGPTGDVEAELAELRAEVARLQRPDLPAEHGLN